MTNRVRAMTVVMLAIACAFQLYVLASGYGLEWMKATWRTRGMPSMDRAARFLLGNGEARYMRFLASVVPQDAAVVLPIGAGEFSQQNILQFFLMPRGIPGCPCRGLAINEESDSCSVCLAKADHYVPAIAGFPPEGAQLPSKQFLPYPADTGWFHGVYVPDGSPGSPGAYISLQPPGPPLGLAIAADVAIWAVVAVVGAMIARGMSKDVGWVDAGLLAIPIGTGLLTWGVFVTSWANGGRVSLVGYVAVMAIMGVGAVTLAQPGGRLTLPSRDTIVGRLRRLTGKGAATASALLLVALSALLIAAVISVGRSYSIFDDIANWALKGYAIADFGTIFAGASWGGHGLSYPQNVPLLIGLFRLVDEDLLPGSKLLFPLLFASIAGACFRSWRHARVSPLVAALGVLVLVTTPVLFIYATTGYANIPFTAYLVLGVLWVKQGLDDQSRSAMGLGVLLLAFATWTRPEGIGFSLACLALLLASSPNRGIFLRAPLAPAAPFVAIAGAWMVFGTRYQANDEIGQVIRAFVTSGRFEVAGLTILADHSRQALLAVDTWGILFPLLGTLVVLAAMATRGIRKADSPGMLLVVLLLTGIPLAMFYAASYSSADFGQFLDVSFDRAMFPACILGVWTAVAAVGRGWKADDHAPRESSEPRLGIELSGG